MARSLPPLPQLRSFEAAARFLSFKQAAESLHVTPSAVSHAVQALEDFLGVKLFHRVASGKRWDKALVLSDAGQVLFPCLMKSFDEIEEVVTAVMAQGAGDILTIAIAPIFAKSWLMPRLHRFVERHLDVSVRINSTLTPADSLFGEFDVGLMYGQGTWPGQEATMLFGEEMVPVCSPRLLRHGPGLNGPEDLNRYTLIHSEARLVSWAMWLETMGVAATALGRGLHFNRATLAIEAAMNGLGVALEGRTAVEDELRRGLLVIPFESKVVPDQREGYYLTCPQGQRDVAKVELFRQWVLEEIALQNKDK